MVRQDLWKFLLKKERFELSFAVREVGGRFRKLAGSEFQTVRAMKRKERSPTDLSLRLGISVSRWRIRGCVKSDMCREKLKDVYTCNVPVLWSLIYIYACTYRHRPLALYLKTHILLRIVGIDTYFA